MRSVHMVAFNIHVCVYISAAAQARYMCQDQRSIVMQAQANRLNVYFMTNSNKLVVLSELSLNLQSLLSFKEPIAIVSVY